MSIVITAVTPYAVIQVSDMQITAFKDGTIVSARQRKSVVLKGQQVVALFGWTGLATIGGHNTGQWLHGQLDAMRAVDLSLVDIAKGLEDNAVENRINADGNTEVKVKGWFKVDHLPGPDDPPMPLLTFSGFPSTPMIGIGGQSPAALDRTHEKG